MLQKGGLRMKKLKIVDVPRFITAMSLITLLATTILADIQLSLLK